VSGRAGHPRIGLAIPTWRGAVFLAETLDSALAQRGVDLAVFVGVDGDDAETRAVAEGYSGDSRVRVVGRRSRLGWVGNTSATLAGVVATGVDFAAILPHDDIVDPDYLRTLHAVLADQPQAACAYSDLVCFGDNDVTVRQTSVTGAPVERQMALLRRHRSAVAWRGLTRASVLKAALPMAGNGEGDFAADTVWMARLARFGELIRVPRALYRKRIHPGNTHVVWSEWGGRRKTDAWLEHCRDMFAESIAVAETDEDRRRLRGAAARRMRKVETWLGELPAPQRRRAIAAAKAMRAAQPPPTTRPG
jgi:glycosyltransferase involved in cell wall biosynthesis